MSFLLFGGKFLKKTLSFHKRQPSRSRSPNPSASTSMTVDNPSTVGVAQSFNEALAQMGRAQKKVSQLQEQQPLLQQQSRQPVQMYQTGDSQPSHAAPQDSGSAPTSQRRPQVFPWSTRRLAFPPPYPLMPPRLLPDGSSHILVPSPSPFPRYGFAISPITTSNGEIYLFGGLVRDNAVSGDMYLITSQDFTVTLIETTGDLPSPRVGHASELVNNVLIVWGGDTKQDGQANPEESHDNSLYLFNTASREWIRVVTAGDSPVGRYGHATAMIGTKFFIFGGQVEGRFLNDLWAFDFNTVTTPVWEQYHPSDSISPPPRANHVCVAYAEKIYIFGGTDGQFHYNDTWEFDVVRRTWKELGCIGYIPIPREAHAGAMVGDVMYVFGGRNTNGKDLSDLAAFKISNHRWYTFQNMGPEPAGRSGHAMASSGTRLFVLGGAFGVAIPEDTDVIHVLDTKGFKYPDGTKNTTTLANQSRAM